MTPVSSPVLPTTSTSLGGRHSRQPSQHATAPTPYSLATRLVHLVRRSVLVQLVLALVVVGLVVRPVAFPSLVGGARNSHSQGYTTSDGVLDIGGGEVSSTIRKDSPAVKHIPTKELTESEIGVAVGWDLDGVYRVLTAGVASLRAAGQGLSSLGVVADRTFQLLEPDKPDLYWATLETFVHGAGLPPALVAQLLASLEMYGADSSTAATSIDSDLGMRHYKKIWQTAKHDQARDNGGWTTRNDGWAWSLLDDAEAVVWAKQALDNRSDDDQLAVGLWGTWEKMGDSGKGGILRSDMLRYLLMLVEGGVYTDTDTNCLKPIDQWGKGARIFLPKEARSQGDAKVVIGIEADVGTREDWHDWWSRPLQFVQWTIAASPHHPIFVDVLRRISDSTTRASAWLDARAALADKLREQGNSKEAKRVESLSVFDVKGDEGESERALGVGVSVMEWTGPGVWTDSVMSYLRAKYGLSWPIFKDLHRPLRVGEVAILPVTGFSPGVGLFGAQATWDAEAMVEHQFRGSWKDE